MVIAASLNEAGDGQPRSATQVAADTLIPEPTVRKVLKRLAQQDVVTSTRGASGGYALRTKRSQIPILEVIEAFEGKLAITQCTDDSDEACSYQAQCDTRPTWERINDAITAALSGLMLSDMVAPRKARLVPLRKNALVKHITDERQALP